LSLKTKIVEGFSVWPQNRQLWFGDLGLKITVTVSYFGPQNQADFGLSVAPQNRRREVGAGHASRSSSLLDMEASLARVFQATVVLNIQQLVNIVLDSSTNYASWRDLMEQALQRYALIKHITDDTPSNDPGWIRMDSVILN
jgi:hypothetical protein